MEVIELVDESGIAEKFNIIDTFGIDDDNYAVLMPVSKLKSMTYILKIVETSEDGATFSTIDDEDEFNEAIKVYEELKKEKIN